MGERVCVVAAMRAGAAGGFAFVAGLAAVGEWGAERAGVAGDGVGGVWFE